MSSGLTLPDLIGRGWSVTKTPIWKTKVQEAVNGHEKRAAFFSKPRWKFQLTYDVLSADVAGDLQSLMGFFNVMRGSFEDFYYSDPTDCTALDTSFGTGDGVTRSFPLIRQIGPYAEGVLAVAVPTIKVAGAPVSPSIAYGMNTTTVTFAVAPSAGQALTWSGAYVFRCRFTSDQSDFENFLHQLWQLKKLEFITVK